MLKLIISVIDANFSVSEKKCFERILRGVLEERWRGLLVLIESNNFDLTRLIELVDLQLTEWIKWHLQAGFSLCEVKNNGIKIDSRKLSYRVFDNS